MAALKGFDCNDIMIFLVTMPTQTTRTLLSKVVPNHRILQLPNLAT